MHKNQMIRAAAQAATMAVLFNEAETADTKIDMDRDRLVLAVRGWDRHMADASDPGAWLNDRAELDLTFEPLETCAPERCGCVVARIKDEALVEVHTLRCPVRR